MHAQPALGPGGRTLATTSLWGATSLKQTNFRAVGALYALYFFGNGLYAPYLALYLSQSGLAGGAVGLIWSMIPLGAMAGSPLLARWADARSSSAALRLLFIVSSLLFLPMLITSSPGLLALLTFGFGAFSIAVIPTLDGWTVSAARRAGARYGRIRLWGSAGFAAASLLGGHLGDRFGLELNLLLAVAAWLSCLAVVPFAGMEEPPPAARRGLWLFASLPAGLLPVLLTLAPGFLANATHSVLFAIHLDQLGLGSRIVGLAWFIGVLAEVCFLWFVDGLIDRAGSRWVVTLGFAAGVARWGVMAAAHSPVLIIAVQTMHAFTFGAVHAGAVRLVADVVPESQRAQGQSLIGVTQHLTAGFIGSNLAGFLSDFYPIRWLYAGSCVLAAVTVALLALARPAGRSRPHRGELSEAASQGAEGS